MKNLFYLSLFLLFISCGGEQPKNDTTEDTSDVIELFGNTQGTTYSIICNDPIDIERDEVEETLHNFDLALSSYIPNSALTKINESTAGRIAYQDSFNYFNRCYVLSQEVYKTTAGAFDPTVYPLVDGWGFMKDMENVPDSSEVDSLRSLLGFNRGYHFDLIREITEAGDTVPANIMIKNTSGAKLDFNAIAQGLAVDVLAELIESKGGKNYFVEIGGEIRVRGKNKEGEWWRIGIDKPLENSDAGNRELQEIVQIENRSIATSGSYRKFYEKDGVKYSHTLNPKTGYPVTHSLLSSTVVADNCALADAMATALMVMGPEKGMEFVKANPDLDIEVYLIFENDKGRMETYMTSGFQELITE